MDGDAVDIALPDPLYWVFTPPRGAVDYRGAYGGRGSGKSFTFAKMAAIFGYAEPLRILCTRELQVSIRESFHAELKNAIQSTPWLNAFYEVGTEYIRGPNGTEFIFRGLRHNIAAIKSMAQIDLAIVEEAEDVPEHSWVDFEPTIRKDKSEIWVIWNPRDEGSPVDKRFRGTDDARMRVAEINWRDNRWFPETLNRRRLRDRERMDGDTYEHVWEGAYLKNTEAQVLNGKWRVGDLTPVTTGPQRLRWDGPYFGADWGFSQDPSTLVRFWLRPDGGLFVEDEASAVGCDRTRSRGAGSCWRPASCSTGPSSGRTRCCWPRRSSPTRPSRWRSTSGTTSASGG